jgi:hypothetical protein
LLEKVLRKEMSRKSSMKGLRMATPMASPWKAGRQTADLPRTSGLTSTPPGMMDDDGKSRMSRGDWKKTDGDSVMGSAHGNESQFRATGNAIDANYSRAGSQR